MRPALNKWHKAPPCAWGGRLQPANPSEAPTSCLLSPRPQVLTLLLLLCVESHPSPPPHFFVAAPTRCAILRFSVQKPCRAHPYHCRTSVPTGALASVWRWGVFDGAQYPRVHAT